MQNDSFAVRPRVYFFQQNRELKEFEFNGKEVRSLGCPVGDQKGLVCFDSVTLNTYPEETVTPADFDEERGMVEIKVWRPQTGKRVNYNWFGLATIREVG